ncbi:TRAP transporter small permease subunit [Rhodoferax sp.]|uniref:TRAP transporter small permease subunit n=1 Tax=Rhodoferax sp. TaxID=50421 RepID=UPI00374DA770
MPPTPAWYARPLQQLNRSLVRLTAAASLLVIPLTLLLCAQWPLRDLLHAYSREANDLAQLLFGGYVSVAMVYATRSQAHLTPDVLARRYPARLRRRLLQCATLGIVLPWAGFILYAAAPMVWQSVLQLERFPDTFTPGYFILKIAVMLLAWLAILQALVDLLLPVADLPA